MGRNGESSPRLTIDGTSYFPFASRFRTTLSPSCGFAASACAYLGLGSNRHARPPCCTHQRLTMSEAISKQAYSVSWPRVHAPKF
jgi:hypothetical protein